MTWRDLFEVAVVGARKPEFFSTRGPFFEVVSEEGLLRLHRRSHQARAAYFGGNAALVEQYLGLSGRRSSTSAITSTPTCT